MASPITNAFVHEYEDNVTHVLQQDGSKLLDTVTRKQVTGESASFLRLDKVNAVERLERNARLNAQGANFLRRRVYLRDFRVPTMIDKEDELRMIIDPKSPVVEAQAKAIGRKIDECIISAFKADAIEVSNNSTETTVSFNSAYIIDEDEGATNANLTVAKLRAARKKLMQTAGNIMEDTVCAINTSAAMSLLSDTTFGSFDYNQVKVLVEGNVGRFMGFNFVVLANGMLPGSPDGSDSNLVKVYAYVKSGVGYGEGRGIVSHIDEMPEFAHAYLIQTHTTGNAVRLEEEKVVEIELVQASGDN